MTRMRVRRRSEPVEAVQWHNPGDWHPAVTYDCSYPGCIAQALMKDGEMVRSGQWIVPEGSGYRVLTPEQFAAEYERVE